MKTLIVVACLLAGLPQPAIAQGTGDGPPRDPAAIAGSRQKRVLVLYSTRRDAQLAIVGDRELPRILEGRLEDGVDYYSEFLDQARVADVNYQDAFGDFLEVKYGGDRFDIVIAVGEAPLTFVASHRGVFGDAPLVYFTERESARPANATGLVARLNLSATLELATTLQPEIRTVVVVSGASSVNVAYRELAEAQFRPYEHRLTFRYLSGLRAAELEAQLAALPDDAIVYYLIVDRDGAGEIFHPLDYVNRLTAIAAVPVYCWVDSAIGRGIVGGSLKSQVTQTRAIGALALRVLQGESADAIPIQPVDLNRVELDWRQLQRWGILESRVPAGAVVHFREPRLWDRYGDYIIAAAVALLAQFALIVGLVVQRALRRKAEAQILDKQDELRRSYERIRSLGLRLLNAQESERAHVARELHDDISQQMSLLGIDLEQLNAEVDGKAAALAGEALSRTNNIARSIHDLSHRLHPARLRLLGLVGALRGLQRELSQPGVAVTVTSTEVPPLTPELTLSLFRIVQEALQNAIKHGKAQNAAVVLSSSDGKLQLTISDDGAGFDVERTGETGLGLISMRERLDALGGDLTIRSTPGEGTILEVAVPLNAASVPAS